MFGVKARDFEEISKTTGNFTCLFYFADYYLFLPKYFVIIKYSLKQNKKIYTYSP
jgi:hypothetical protein